MRHVLVYDAARRPPVAFLSFLDTTEPDGRGRMRRVLYCYELQVSPPHQGLGLGSMLLGVLEEEARRVLPKPLVMLTCFTRNEAAMRFYRRHGYRRDPISPSRLEGGGSGVEGEVEVEYEILFKRP